MLSEIPVSGSVIVQDTLLPGHAISGDVESVLQQQMSDQLPHRKHVQTIR
jgi:hypothetical protein